MKNLLIILLLIFTVSCKEESSNTEVQTIENIEDSSAEQVIKQLRLGFSFKTNTEDVFKIMLNNITVDDLQTKSIHFTEQMPPMENFEEIVAVFDPNNFSQDLAISLGNAKVKEVILDKITISYGDKAVMASTVSEINDNIVFNKYIDFNQETKVLKTKKLDGQHFPTIIIRPRVLASLSE